MLLDFGVHRIGREIQISRPRYRAAVEFDLRKERFVGQRCKDSGVG